MKPFFKISLALIAVLLLSCCQSKSERKLQNIETFAHLYGYARWFHPSDEAQDVDWDKFAVLGVQKVQHLKSNAALRDTLYNLFSPIIQGLQIYKTDQPEIFNPEILTPATNDKKPVFWQHSGVNLGMKSNTYTSIRSNKNTSQQPNYSTTGKDLSNLFLLKGKQITLSGYFKIKNLTDQCDIKLAIQAFQNDSPSANQYVDIKSDVWKKYEITLKIPLEATSIFYGFVITGEGTVWADDFQFIANNNGTWEPIDDINMGFENGSISQEEKDWYNQQRNYLAEVATDNPHSGKYCFKASYIEQADKKPAFGEIIKEPIGSGLTCVVPLVLYNSDSATFPKTEEAILERLKSELANINIDTNFNSTVNLASVIITWNVIQHFFPYFDVIDTDWNAILDETLKNVLSDKNKKEFYVTLCKMMAKLNDGHGIVFNEEMFHLPIHTELIENNIVITASENESVQQGDIIKTVDGKPAMDVLLEIEKTISGSPHLRRHRALNIFGSKYTADSTEIKIEREGAIQTIQLNNDFKKKSMFFNSIGEKTAQTKGLEELEPGIYYINFSKCTKENFNQQINELSNAKAIIYDNRGGSAFSFFDIIPHLIDKPAASAWWNVPQVIYPDRKDMTFNQTNWYMYPQKPLFKGKNIIINVPAVVSSGETEMGIIDNYHLAVTVGEPTAGCNGNVNTIVLPCGYSVWFTGMRVLKHDGSQLYGVGFAPDYPVSRTLQAVKEGRDEFLEKALEIARLP